MCLKLTFFSDTHGHHKKLPQLEGGHILFFMGDCAEKGYQHEIHTFLKWFGNIKSYDYKVMIGGNHDGFLQWQPEEVKKMLSDTDIYGDIIYLEDESIELMGYKVYGSPYSPRIGEWAFDYPRNSTEALKQWSKIPSDTDILLTHGAPHQILDFTRNSEVPVGCKALQDRVINVSPLIHAFGHIHDSYGTRQFADTMFVNGSIMDNMYMPTNKPINLKLNVINNEVTYGN